MSVKYLLEELLKKDENALVSNSAYAKAFGVTKRYVIQIKKEIRAKGGRVCSTLTAPVKKPPQEKIKKIPQKDGNTTFRKTPVKYLLEELLKKDENALVSNSAYAKALGITKRYVIQIKKEIRAKGGKVCSTLTAPVKKPPRGKVKKIPKYLLKKPKKSGGQEGQRDQTVLNLLKLEKLIVDESAKSSDGFFHDSDAFISERTGLSKFQVTYYLRLLRKNKSLMSSTKRYHVGSIWGNSRKMQFSHNL